MGSLFYILLMFGEGGGEELCFIAAFSEISINRQNRNLAFSPSYFPKWTPGICTDKSPTEASKDFIMKGPSPALRINLPQAQL